MRHLQITLILLFSILTQSICQDLTQTIRGQVKDLDSHSPLIGAEVIVYTGQEMKGTITDVQGAFKLDGIQIGRVNIEISYLGYEKQILSNVIINSGKQSVLDIHLEESIHKLKEIQIIANQKGSSLNDMSILSSRSISAEETNRYAGGFNDPSRILSNFAGVTNTQDGGNDIIVRGNSPKYIQWRLEGIQISNPNHFGDQSGVGGATSTLNNNILGTSDFHTGAFTAEYGDVLSGVYDVKLRSGNNEKFESVFGFGLLGTDITLEGSISKKSNGSFLVNYRYSTASIISDLGLLGDIGGIPKFQDAAFKILLPTKKVGIFSLFGLSGFSSFNWEDVTPALWETPGENIIKDNQRSDYLKESHLINIGLNHTYSFSDNSFLKTSLLFSTEGIDDKIYDQSQVDSTLFQLNFDNSFEKKTYRISSTYYHKINAQNKIQVGSKGALFDFGILQSQIEEESRKNLASFNGTTSSIRNFISWKYKPTKHLTLIAGIHNMNFLYTKESTIEPRLALKLGNLSLGYGRHSTLESMHNYFTQIESSDGTPYFPNKDLKLLKADHLVFSYEKRLKPKLNIKAELYYQRLFDLPVENNDTSYYATINEGLEFRYIDLVNEGSGKNYGLEITLEKFFDKHFYYLLNASLYNSKYTSLEGQERNTQYNGNYLINFLCGKEFINLGKKKNQVLSVNAKVFYGGGKKIIPLLRNTNGELAINSLTNEYYNYDEAYQDKIEDIYNVIISFSYKWNKQRSTHELFLNLDNITNTKGKISEYYDENEPGNIGYVSQFGFFPNLMYRVYF